MAQVIKLKRSAVAGKTPQTSSLELGELAVNTTDGKIYFHRSSSSDDTVQTVFTTDSTITGSLKLSGSQHISGSVGVMDDITFIGDMSSSLTSTSSFSRLISVETASIGYLEVTGSNFATFDTETGSFASGSDLQIILAESASYVVSTGTGSYVVNSQTSSFASGSDLQVILAESASYLFDAVTASLGKVTLASDITGSITSTGSFGKIFGDGSDLENVADPTAISGSYLGMLSASHDLTLGLGASGSITSTASFGLFKGDGSGLSNVTTETGSFASGSDLQVILAESASYVTSTSTGSYVQQSATASLGAVGITDTLFVSGNITTSGSVIAREFKTEFVSSSIIYSSGSNKFGDTLDDLHRFTGSLETTSSTLTIDSVGGVSGSITSTASFATLELDNVVGLPFATGSDLHTILAQSASYVTSGLTTTLTPSSSSNKILILLKEILFFQNL